MSARARKRQRLQEAAARRPAPPAHAAIAEAPRAAAPAASSSAPAASSFAARSFDPRREAQPQRTHSQAGRRATPASATAAPTRPRSMLSNAYMARVAAETRERENQSSSDEEPEEQKHGGGVAAAAPSTSTVLAVDDESSSGSDFLCSQAEIREKQRRHEAQRKALQEGVSPSTASSASLPARAAALPGYFFDSRVGKYFKLLPGHIHAAAAGHDADETLDPDAHVDAPTATPSSHASARFASLRVAGDPRLHAQAVHAQLGASARQQSKSARERKRPPKQQQGSSAPTVSSAVPSSLLCTHLQSRSRSLPLDVLSRSCIWRSSAAVDSVRRLREHVFGLLRPLPGPLLRWTPNEDAISAEHALAFDEEQRILTVAGKRRWCCYTGRELRSHSGSFQRSYVLKPPLRSGAADSDVSDESDDDDEMESEHQSLAPSSGGPPFRMRSFAPSATDSPITSMHHFSKWTQEAEGSMQHGAQQYGIRSVLAFTELGSTNPGCLRIDAVSPGGGSSGQEPERRLLFHHAVADGSVYTSAFAGQRSFGRVSLGCSKGALVIDVPTSRVVHRSHTNRSDVLAQCWVQRDGCGDGVLLLNGLRNGMVCLDDTRVRGRVNAAAAGATAGVFNLKLGCSISFLQQLDTNPHHLVAAAADGMICMYDVRRLSAGIATPAPASSSSMKSLVAATSSSSLTQQTQPLLQLAGSSGGFTPVHPCVREDAGVAMLFCEGDSGCAQGWSLRTGERVLHSPPLHTGGHARRTAGAGASRQSVYMSAVDTLLCGSDVGLAALTLEGRGDGHDAASSGPTDVVILTPDNFDEVVGHGAGVFVEFFAPWCGHCKSLAPQYELVAGAFAKIGQKQAIIASVDADAHRTLGSRFDVKGFPTLKWFAAGSTEPEAYSGGRTAEDILSFVNSKAGTNARLVTKPTHVVELDDSDFDSVVMDSSKDVLVEFYAPWCGHCKKLTPEYEKAAESLAGESGVVVAKIDADKYKSVGSKYGVTGFPSQNNA